MIDQKTSMTWDPWIRFITLLFLEAYFHFRCRNRNVMGKGRRQLGSNPTVSTETFQGCVSQIASLRVHCLRCGTVGARHPFHSKHPIIVKSAWSAFEFKRNVSYVHRRHVRMHRNTTYDFIMALLKKSLYHRPYSTFVLPSTQCVLTQCMMLSQGERWWLYLRLSATLVTRSASPRSCAIVLFQWRRKKMVAVQRIAHGAHVREVLILNML